MEGVAEVFDLFSGVRCVYGHTEVHRCGSVGIIHQWEDDPSLVHRVLDVAHVIQITDRERKDRGRVIMGFDPVCS